MPNKTPETFRDFVQVLRDNGQLLDIQEEVSLDPGVSSAAQAGLNLSDQSPGLLFHNLQGYSDATIAMNMAASWPNMALSFGLPAKTPQLEVYLELLKRWRNAPLKCEYAPNPPFLAHSYTENINLFDILPLFRVNTRDGGPYITKGCVITRDLSDPDNLGKQNVSIMRIQVKNKDTMGMQIVVGHDAQQHLRIAEEMGKNLPVAIAIGVDPALVQAATAPIAYDKSEFEYAGAIQGSPYKLYHSDFTGLDLPWGAEYILEGEIVAGAREIEGPFGEFTGYYASVKGMTKIVIKRVLHRDKPIFENLQISRPWNEEDYITAYNNGVVFQEQLETNFTGIRAVNAMHAYGLTVIVSCKPARGGMAKAIGMRTMTTSHGLICAKTVIVVDEDIDPFNSNDVFLALSTNMNPKYDVVVIPNLTGIGLDPSSELPGVTHKLIIDATRPVAPETHGRYGRPIDYPEDTEVWMKKLQNLFNR